MSTTTNNQQEDSKQLDDVIYKWDYEEILARLKEEEHNSQQLVQYRLWTQAKRMKRWGLTLDEIEEMLDNIFVKTKQIIMSDVDIM
jgi:hypothetical protein